MSEAKSASAAGLYLVVDVAGDALARVRAALAASHPATLLLTHATGVKPDAAALKPIVEHAQGLGVATLVADDPQLARTLRADGVHLHWSRDIEARLAEAREILGTRYIVGAEAGETRHEAMVLGEAGADYVGFNGPAPGQPADSWDDHIETVAWWAEIFEVPCVAFGAESTGDLAELADAGADFVAVTVGGGLAPEQAAGLVADAVAALAKTRSAA